MNAPAIRKRHIYHWHHVRTRFMDLTPHALVCPSWDTLTEVFDRLQNAMATKEDVEVRGKASTTSVDPAEFDCVLVPDKFPMLLYFTRLVRGLV